jgi:uroporphyrinogen-III synthase
MKTTWAAFSVDTPTPPVQVLADHSIGKVRPDSDIGRLSQLASRISSATPLDEILSDVIAIVAEAVTCDSCTLYVAEGEELVLRAWSNLHHETAGRVKAKSVFQITGLAGERREPVVATQRAPDDPRVMAFFTEPVAERFESFLSIPMVSGGRLIGAINLQNRECYAYGENEIGLIGTLCSLVGTELERARLESQNLALVDRLEVRKVVERAKGILQRDLRINEEDAYLMLQRESRQRRKTMKEVAEAIILSDDLKKKK